MEYLVFAIVALALLVLFFLQNWYSNKKAMQNILLKCRESYGLPTDKKYDKDNIEPFKTLFYRHMNDESVDDITANDLDMDDIFRQMDYTKSAMGTEYLYSLLRNPIRDEDELNDMERKIGFFQDNEQARIDIVSKYLQIGSMHGVSFYDCLDFFGSIPQKNLLLDYMFIAGFFISIGLIFVAAPIGILLLVADIIGSIILYYSRRGSIESYIVSFSFMAGFLERAGEMSGLKYDALKDDIEAVKKDCGKLKGFLRNSGLVTSSKVSAVGTGNPFDMLIDYGKMIFHFDIIQFYKMLKFVNANKDGFDSLYVNLGRIESYVSIAYYRASLEEYCIPKRGNKLVIKGGYHPLISNPVANSIIADRGVLITGSNASGKSTFLKMVALNSIFANTIHTCTAREYENEYVHVFSSMSLRDSISGNDSYFMVEIKAIKRILDYVSSNANTRVMCFVDEVLRGTNTVERISAGCEILKNFAKENVLCFAATHDGELTILLEDYYDNYHFDEEIADNDVLFNYKIKEGRATSKNAIKLLSVMGYSSQIVESAEQLSKHFVETGEWINNG